MKDRRPQGARLLVLVTVLVAVVLWNGLQGSIDLFRHYPAPKCSLETPHQHGLNVRGCDKWGEAYGPSMDWIQAMHRLNVEFGQNVNLEAFSMVIVGGLMSGFRQVATTILWMKSDQYWHEGKADRFLPILRAVTWLDPNFLDGWRIAGWHWAYNLYAQARDIGEQEKCLQNGLNFLKEGIVWNPNSSELHFELGWTYYDKAGDYRNAVEWFQKARTKEDYKKNYKIDTAQHMIGHAYERIPDIEGALRAYAEMLKLTPEEREVLDRWIEFKRRYRSVKKLVKTYNNLNPAPPPATAMPGMPQGAMPSPQQPEKPKSDYVFVECKHLKRSKLTKDDILRELPDMEKWKRWAEFDSVVDAYEGAKNKGDTATMGLIRKYIPNIEEAASIRPVVRKIETREPPAPGATITIKMRYLEAWRLYQAKKYAEAEKTILDSMELEPEEASFPIAHHQLARIYERMADLNKGETECPICRAEPDKLGSTKIVGWKQHPEWKRHSLERHKAYFDGWVEGAQHNQMNRLAHAQVYRYQVQYNMPKVSVKKPPETVPDTFRTPGGGPQIHQPKD